MIVDFLVGEAFALHLLVGGIVEGGELDVFDSGEGGVY
jgi:hypothetical protein